METQPTSGLWHWRIVQFSVGLSLLGFVLIFIIGGFNEESTRQCIRLSAKVSVVLFCMAFSASAVQGLLHNVLTFWWRMNRKYLGISFAIAHLLHLFFLVLLQQCFHPVFTLAKTSSLAAGGTVYLFLVLMLLTSFQRFSHYLSKKQWKLLHTVGGWWIWGIFASSYFKRVLHGEMDYLPWAGLVAAVGVLRVVALFRKQR
ncbi:MAG: hypothetical protein K9J37_17925 [Saprospiraceae bacterium]|nr:hypothetical protein [Saprospiraceae bacterium]MCF8251797.1 hypothetical protein [Saprospiraceae bacterium]MCF8281451.1 hypothetical protein [Bacteroidales bacterium]MCF8313511.1 hypothetical protein [Saprospiraceae bacterium]MCF8442266.1 hypothetical protein [Saprospiraceae bacterium]